MKKASEDKYVGPLTQTSAPATRLGSGEVLHTPEDHEAHAASETAAAETKPIDRYSISILPER